MRIGYHASHEQFSPGKLLELVKLAETSGFEAVLSSDHFFPWSLKQGHSGFSWSWLGAALSITEKMTFGIVTTPGYRMHPAIVAQASATLLEMFPDRFWLSIGSGQNLNEAITGEVWPSKLLRNKKLFECSEIIRKLWKGERVTHFGHVFIEEARLFTRPPHSPLLIGAAISAETAGWVGSWADGMITISRPLNELEEIVGAFREKGGDKPIFLKVQLSYAPDYEQALSGAWEQWKTNVFGSDIQSTLRFPEEFDTAAKVVKKEDLKEHIIISSDPEVMIEELNSFIQMGFEELYLHNVNVWQKKYIRDFGKNVLPYLKGRNKA